MSTAPQFPPGSPTVMGRIAATWGVVGVLLLLWQAVMRMTPLAIEPLVDGGLSVGQWGVWLGWVTFMVYSEGYRGFHRMFSPRVVVRASTLLHRPPWHLILLAPVFCMGLFHGTRKRLIVSRTVFVGIVCLVIAVRQLVQPWRGIIDGGVVIGLAIGMLSILWFASRAVTGVLPNISPDLPEFTEASLLDETMMEPTA